MSENPFASPQPVSGGYAQPEKKKAPGALTAILIISMVLGILGLLGSCAGGVGLAMQSQINDPQANNANAVEQQMQQELAEIQQKQFIPNVIVMGLNFVVAPLLAVGAIGGLNRKSWTPKILGLGLLLAAMFVFVRTIITVFLQISMKDAMGKMVQTAMRQQGGEMNQQGAEFAATAMNVGIFIAIAFAAVWALILIGFYLWSWTYLRKENVQQYFEAT